MSQTWYRTLNGERRLLKIQCHVYVDWYIKREIMNQRMAKRSQKLEFQFQLYVSLKMSLTILFCIYFVAYFHLNGPKAETGALRKWMGIL